MCSPTIYKAAFLLLLLLLLPLASEHVHDALSGVHPLLTHFTQINMTHRF
jgi:hypothetical protein